MYNMATKTAPWEYQTPICELSASVPSLLCDSEDCTTESFDDLGTFEW